MGKQGFRELEVWRISKEFAVEVYKITCQSSFNGDYGLKDQIRRSAVSIPSNIAEGDERDTDKDSVKHFYIAKGSLAELITQIEIAKDIGYISDEQLITLSNKCELIGKKIGALINFRKNKP